MNMEEMPAQEKLPEKPDEPGTILAKESPAAEPMVNVEEVKQQDAAALKKAREALGLETPAAVEEEPSFVSPEILKDYRINVENLSERCSQLQFLLGQRIDAGHSDLIDPGDIGRLTDFSRELQEVKIKGPEDLRHIEDIAAKLAVVIESIGDIRERGLNDDPESLEAVADSLREFHGDTDAIAANFRSMDAQGAREADHSFQRLRDIAEERYGNIMQKKEALENYLRG